MGVKKKNKVVIQGLTIILDWGILYKSGGEKKRNQKSKRHTPLEKIERKKEGGMTWGKRISTNLAVW